MIPNLFPTQSPPIIDVFQVNRFQLSQQQPQQQISQIWQYNKASNENSQQKQSSSNFNNNNLANLFTFGQQTLSENNNGLFSVVGNTFFNTTNTKVQQTITITLQYGSQKELVVLERTQDSQVKKNN